MKPAIKPPKKYKTKYPWKTWMTSRTPFALIAGRDFTGLPSSMGLYIRAKVRRHGERYGVTGVQVNVMGDRIRVLMNPPDSSVRRRGFGSTPRKTSK